MTSVLLTIGDEILLGQVVNTNAAWLGEKLALAGVDVRRSETVGDEPAEIAAALTQALDGGADLVVVTGGLGPTHDDITKTVVADVFGRPLVFRPDLYRTVEARYTSRGRAMPASARVLAEVPEGFDVLPNPKGTAAGLWGERTVDGRRQVVVMMPGVPYEMEAISEGSVLPRLRELRPGAVVHRTLQTVGKGESDLSAILGDLADLTTDGLALAFLPSAGVVRLRVTAKGADVEAARARVDRAAARIRQSLGDLVFAEGDVSLEAAVLDALAAQGKTLAVAESCTGGALAARLTSVPGASRAFEGAVVAYGNGVKHGQLGVRGEDLDTFGAVSEPVALQMARGVREALGADVGVSATGIAGPGGGTPEKPVGTVWVACADAADAHAVRLQLTQDRSVNIALSTTAALNLVRRRLLHSVSSEVRGPS